MTRLLLASLAACSAFAQTAPPAFDVASIRPTQGGMEMRGHGPFFNIKVSPDTVNMRAVNLRTCIRWAYHVMDYQVSGPDTIMRDRYDVMAKAPAAVEEDQLRAMMQTLLADRFKMAFHRQSKEMSGYALVVGKGGPKFQESKTEGESAIDPDQSRMQVSIQRTSIAQLIEMLSNMFRAPIIDETGLKAKYDVTINVAKYLTEIPHGPGERGGGGEGAGAGAGFDPMSLIMRGLQEELGLKLESRSKMPVDFLIVDHIEKAPTEN